MILAFQQARGPQKNISFLAFTATPRNVTLERFGRIGADGLPHPFHLYSMRQAIEEGFILDVLQNYMTYKAYYNSKRPLRTTLPSRVAKPKPGSPGMPRYTPLLSTRRSR
jgi:type I restriction enzyme R subunit